MSLQRIPSGIEGFDKILHGGLIPNRSYLLRGGPGTGKTTFGLHYLTASSDSETTPLFITLDEQPEEIRADARRMGFAMEDVEFLDLSPDPNFFSNNQQYDVFETTDVDWGPIREQIMDAVESIDPGRVFIDSVSHFRHLSPDVYQFRKQILSFVRYLLDRNTTVMLVSQGGEEGSDDLDVQFLADSVISLYRTQVREVEVDKFRGSSYQDQRHHLTISDGGIEIYPRILEGYGSGADPDLDGQHSSGLESMDRLLNGGIERGTSTMLTGPTGVGKTTTGIQFLKQAAREGETCLFYSFEEKFRTLNRRSKQLGLDLEPHIESGHIQYQFVGTEDYTAWEFVHKIRKEVQQTGASLVMVDSLTGWSASMREAELEPVLRTLTNHLKDEGITALLINEINQITGDFRVSEEHVSHLSDNIVFLRYVELQSEMRKIIGVLKKRMSDSENTLREIQFTSSGIEVGQPLGELTGVLQGIPNSMDS